MVKKLCGIIGLIFLISQVAIFGDSPEIEVDGKQIVDFGLYPGNERKEAIFRIFNIGKGLLQIKNIRKTCGCAEATIDKRDLKTGDIAILKAMVLKNSIYGSYKKNIYVESNDPKERFLILSIKGKATPIMTVKPKSNIYAGTIFAKKEWKQEFLLKANEDNVIIGKIINESNVEANITITNISAKVYSLKVIITPTVKMPVFKTKIKIPIINPKGWSDVELLITGKVK